MAEKHSPSDVGAIKEKIEKGQVKVKGRRTRKNMAQNRPLGVQGENGLISNAEIVAFLKTQDGYVTSIPIRDALGFKSRTQARRILRRLAKAGKVSMGTRKVSDKRQIFTFGVA